MRSLTIVILTLALSSRAFGQDHQHHHNAEPVQAPALSAPSDHAADRYFDAAEMARARAMLRYESGGMGASMVLLDKAEVRPSDDAYAWEGEAWFGQDLNRLTIKTEGEGRYDGHGLESAEAQLLYSRALDPWFNLQVGVRGDIRPEPSRAYAVVGVEGLAPYWFEVGAAVFLSDRGDALARLEGSQDFRLTQKWLLTPSAEINLSAQDIPDQQIGAGVSDVELGLRLHYALTPRAAPYVGLEWMRKFGASADFSHAAGEDTQTTSVVVGVRGWF